MAELSKLARIREEAYKWASNFINEIDEDWGIDVCLWKRGE